MHTKFIPFLTPTLTLVSSIALCLYHCDCYNNFTRFFHFPSLNFIEFFFATFFTFALRLSLFFRIPVRLFHYRVSISHINRFSLSHKNRQIFTSSTQCNLCCDNIMNCQFSWYNNPWKSLTPTILTYISLYLRFYLSYGTEVLKKTLAETKTIIAKSMLGVNVLRMR